MIVARCILFPIKVPEQMPAKRRRGS